MKKILKSGNHEEKIRIHPVLEREVQLFALKIEQMLYIEYFEKLNSFHIFTPFYKKIYRGKNKWDFCNESFYRQFHFFVGKTTNFKIVTFPCKK